MEHKIYRVTKGQKLEDISLETGISSERIRQYHNFNYPKSGNLLGSDLQEHNTEIYLPLKAEVTTKSDDESIDSETDFEQSARYRCSQINTSKVDGNTVHFVEQKFQYLLQQSLRTKIGRVKLEEHLYDFSPAILNASFEFISKTEFIKNDVLFTIARDNGKLKDILNKNEINLQWLHFRDNNFEESAFIKRLQLTNPGAVSELKELGNKQFSISYSLAEEEYRRNLFYFICFDKFLVEPIEQANIDLFPFMSTIVPPVVVPIEFKYDKISEGQGILKIEKTGSLKLTPELIVEIEKKYDEMHKPTIKYGFTEYKLEFTIKIEYNTKKKLVENADLFLTEEIADNIENTCEFHLKQLQNFKP